MRWYQACITALCLAVTGCMMETGEPGEEDLAADQAYPDGSRSIVRVDDVGDEAPTAQPMSLETDNAWVLPEEGEDEEETELCPPEDLGELNPDGTVVQRVRRPEPVPWKEKREPVDDNHREN